VAGTVRLAAEKTSRLVGHWSAPRAEVVSDFDRQWNVDTGGNEDLSELQLIDTTNYLFGNRYQATAPEMFARMLAACPPIRYEDNVFIDCGSGKGRILLLASELPFRRIIGVEFASDLTKTAEANVRAYRSPTQKCHQIEAVCMDATVFQFPNEPTVVFINNPFEGPAMDRFARHVEESLRAHPRPFLLLYRNPTCAKVWDQSPMFARTAADEWFVIYQFIAHAADHRRSI
jgi:hypothetical protein